MSDRATLVAGAGAAVVLVLLAYSLAKKAGLTAPGALDPTNRNNLAYSSVNALGAAVTGDPNYTLGGAIYDRGIFQQPNVLSFVADAALTFSPVVMVRDAIAGVSIPAGDAPAAIPYSDFWIGAP